MPSAISAVTAVCDTPCTRHPQVLLAALLLSPLFCPWGALSQLYCCLLSLHEGSRNQSEGESLIPGPGNGAMLILSCRFANLIFLFLRHQSQPPEESFLISKEKRKSLI